MVEDRFFSENGHLCESEAPQSQQRHALKERFIVSFVHCLISEIGKTDLWQFSLATKEGVAHEFDRFLAEFTIQVNQLLKHAILGLYALQNDMEHLICKTGVIDQEHSDLVVELGGFVLIW